MVEKNKYLSWIKDKNISENELQETIEREMYSRIGAFIAFAQTIEYNLHNINAFYRTISEINKIDILDKLTLYKIIEISQHKYNQDNKKTLGGLMTEFENNGLATEYRFALDKFVVVRNNLMHNLFKWEIFKPTLNDINVLDEFCDNLADYITDANFVNDIMKKYFRNYKEILDSYKSKFE